MRRLITKSIDNLRGPQEGQEQLRPPEQERGRQDDFTKITKREQMEKAANAEEDKRWLVRSEDNSSYTREDM